ncbi:MAG: hypothetical protein J6R94_03995, partial [Agathobacter sp.]|nr:hypothetical protein [Agathobacter sp.]
MKKIWIWLLCVAMVISLVACGESGKDTESGKGTEIGGTENGSENQDTQQGSESTEDSGVDEEALKLYEDAVADLNEMDAMHLDVTIRKTVSLGT